MNLAAAILKKTQAEPTGTFREKSPNKWALSHAVQQIVGNAQGPMTRQLGAMVGFISEDQVPEFVDMAQRIVDAYRTEREKITDESTTG